MNEKFEIRILRFIKELIDVVFDHIFTIMIALWLFGGWFGINVEDVKPQKDKTEQTEQSSGPKPSM